MNNREKELLKIELDDIGNQFQYGDKERAFSRLVEVLKTQLVKSE